MNNGSVGQTWREKREMERETKKTINTKVFLHGLRIIARILYITCQILLPKNIWDFTLPEIHKITLKKNLFPVVQPAKISLSECKRSQSRRVQNQFHSLFS